MGFHRLTVPTYTGGLPPGYDLINSGAAPADGAKVGGPNAGTYFHAFGEDALAIYFNRPARALAENCDYLDDELRSDFVTVVKLADVLAAVPVSSIILPEAVGIFADPARSLNRLFEITDENDVQISGVTGQRCVVVSISGGTPGGDGFTTAPTTLNISPAIPVGYTYRAYYGIRTNWHDKNIDFAAALGVRGMRQTVPAVFTAAGFRNTPVELTIAGVGALGTQTLSWGSMFYAIDCTYRDVDTELVLNYEGTVRPGAVYFIAIRRYRSSISKLVITSAGIEQVLTGGDKYLQPGNEDLGGSERQDLYVGYALSATRVAWTVLRF